MGLVEPASSGARIRGYVVAAPLTKIVMSAFMLAVVFAAMMAAVKFLGECKAELPADLIFVTSTAGETGRHDSLAHVLARDDVKADWAIVDGPPEIQLGNKGRVDIQVVVRGKQTHSSRPWEGIDAIEGAMKVLEKLRPLLPYPSDRSHPDLGKVSLTPTSIESFPKATHTIQSECRVVFDRRLLPIGTRAT